MPWNYRILAVEYKEEIYLQIHEVHYDENGVPNSYTENPVSIGSESIKGIKWSLNKMNDATKKPVLWGDHRFPNECKIRYKCDSCGRYKFTKPTPHICGNQYRRKGLSWTIIGE